MVKCPIWGFEADEIDAGPRDAVGFDSLRTGGRYFVTRTAVAMLANASTTVRLKLTTWLVDQRRFGEETPEISTGTLKQVGSLPLLDLERRRDRLLLFVEFKCPLIDQYIDWPAQVTEERRRTTAELKAWTESRTDSEVSTLISYAREQGLLRDVRDGGPVLQLTFSGFEHLETLEGGGTRSDQCFVAMWFDPTTEAAYNDGIAPAIVEAGYIPFRIDRKEHANKIDDEIIAEIRRSRFLVADFTCGFVDGIAVARGGVYYEAGFAGGLGIPVIWSCRQDMIDHVHFDTRQYNHIVWDAPADLKTKLRNRIGAVIGEGPHHIAATS